MGEEKRHEMMETLFGAESEDSDDDEALERAAPPYSDDEVEGGGQIDAESEGERAGSELDREESEAERVESEAEREDSDVEHSYDEEELSKKQRRPIAAERRGIRQQVSASGSEQSREGGQAIEQEEDEVDQFHRGGNVEEEEEDEVEQVREQSDEGDDSKAADGVAEMRDVFGDSDEEEQEPDETHRTPRVQEEMSASDDEASVQRGIRPEDIVPDEEHRDDEQFESDEEQPAEHRAREKPVGPPLQIDIPLCPPPGPADKMHIVRVSNIMGIESKPFDPKTYIEEEEHFITDESGHKQRLRLEDNVARWRKVRDRDGNVKLESNARFVKWSDGSMQLLIGNEVLDISIQKAQQDQGHLFVRHAKGILQSQGRLLQKMKFMPSSLSSKSHRLLTALVDSRNRKIYKVKNVITNKDPEREKEEAEKLHQKRIRSKEDLQRKQEKISRKYNQPRERAEQQISAGFLEGALMEDEEVDEYQKQMEEEELRAERRIMNAKRASASSREPIGKRIKSRHFSPPRRRDIEERSVEESEHSEYESDGEEEDTRVDEDAHGAEVDEEEEQGEEAEEEDSEGEQEKERGWDDGDDEAFKKRKGRDDDSENEPSPPRKPAQRRRVVVSDSEED